MKAEMEELHIRLHILEKAIGHLSEAHINVNKGSSEALKLLDEMTRYSALMVNRSIKRPITAQVIPFPVRKR